MESNTNEIQIIFSEKNAEITRGTKRAGLSETGVKCFALLLQHQGEKVAKKQILEVCWENKGVYVSDASVRQVIAQLRRALASVGASADMIKTLPRQGYSLFGEVVRHETHSESSGLDDVEQNLTRIRLQDEPTSLSLLRQRWGPGNTFLAAMMLTSITLSLYLYLSRPSEFVHHVQYHFSKELAEGERIYYQEGFRADDDEVRDVLKAVYLGGYSAESARYIYMNKTELKMYTSAFICRSPMATSDSNCLSLLIVRGDHGY